MSGQTGLTITSLNVGRLLQKRTRIYLQSLGATEPLPDVLCLQDMPFRDLPLLERWPHIAFGPMTNHLINGERAVVGVVIASRYFMTYIMHHTVWGDSVLKDLQGVNRENERHLGLQSDALVEATEDRVAVCATIMKDGIAYNMVTTHGMWARGGVVHDAQWECARALARVLEERARFVDGLVLAGDLNFARGGRIYQMFIDKEFHDWVPPEVDNTLDPEHPLVMGRGLKVVTDYIMTCDDFPVSELFRDHPFRISDVRLRSGVSDHCALLATVSRA